MSVLVGLHQRLGIALIVVAGVGTLWAVISPARAARIASLRAYLVFCEIAVGAQVVIGLGLVLIGQRPHSALHWFYGAATLASLPIARVLSRRRPPRQEGLMIVGGALATALFAIRAATTGA